jgi:hypothetical protein
MERPNIGRPVRPVRSDLGAIADPRLMRNHFDLALYCGEVAVGLIAFGVLAVTVHAYVAAEAIVAAVIIAVVTMGSALLIRDGDLER